MSSSMVTPKCRRVVFEPRDKFFVLDVVRQIVGHDRLAVRVADKDPVVRHQAAGDADIVPIAVAVVAGTAGQEVVLVSSWWEKA